jgi:hypothetical protein
MKTLICLILTFLTANHVFGQARPGAYLWTLNLKVVDDNNQPVRDAKTWIAYGDPKQGHSPDPFLANDWAIAGLTDTNGFFMAKHIDHSWSLGIQVQKTGYYPVIGSYDLYKPGQFNDQIVAANRNSAQTLVLKKIKNPTAMYAKQVNLGIPEFNKPLGFDLMIGDWVAPYGTGINTDIIFAGRLDKRAANDSDYTLTVNFPKAGDGIQEFAVPESEKGSELRSPHEAPPNCYQSEWVQTKTRRPGKPLQTNWDMNRNYFFRVRTKLDDKGNVVSARYGKIYGDFMNFAYYLNPTPNDRNIEFDPKQNLIHSLKFDEGVSAP